jgi:hypothetical protein
MRRHLQEQISLYGEQSLVSLVNHKGYEQPVKEAYEKYVTQASVINAAISIYILQYLQVNLPKVRYEYFDFHNECKQMRWDRISLLIDRIQEDLVHQGSVVAVQSFIRLVTPLQILPSGCESSDSRSPAARNRANKLHGQLGSNKRCTSRLSKVDPEPSAANIGHFAAW